MLYTISIAGLVPFVIAVLAATLPQWTKIAPRTSWPIAFTIAFLAGQLAIKSEAGFGPALSRFFQPQEAEDWLPLIVLLALGVTTLFRLGVGTGDGALNASRRLRTLALRAAFAFAVPVRLLSGNVRLAYQWSVFEKFAYLLLIAVTFGLVWRFLGSENDDEPPLLRAALFVLVAAASAIIITQSGAFVAGLSCGAVAAAIAGTTLACTLLPTDRSAGATGSASAVSDHGDRAIASGAAVITFSLGSLILLGHFYAYVSTTSTALLFISLAATSVPLPSFLRPGQIWQRAIVRTLVCVLPLALALISTFS